MIVSGDTNLEIQKLFKNKTIRLTDGLNSFPTSIFRTLLRSGYRPFLHNSCKVLASRKFQW